MVPTTAEAIAGAVSEARPKPIAFSARKRMLGYRVCIMARFTAPAEAAQSHGVGAAGLASTDRAAVAAMQESAP
jgi:hypothetical protein